MLLVTVPVPVAVIVVRIPSSVTVLVPRLMVGKFAMTEESLADVILDTKD